MSVPVWREVARDGVTVTLAVTTPDFREIIIVVPAAIVGTRGMDAVATAAVVQYMSTVDIVKTQG